MSFSTLALLVAVGLVGPLLAALPRLGPPLVVGEILAGVVVGRSGLHLLDVDDPSLNLLAEVGFALLMLIVGTHLPVRQPALRPALKRAALVTGITLGLAVVTAGALDGVTGLGRPAVLAVLLATSSAAVALPVLQSVSQQSTSPIASDGSAVLVTTAWIAGCDVLTVLAIPLVLRQGSLTSVLLGIAEVVLLAALVYLLARWGASRPNAARLRQRSRYGHWALDLRVSLLVLFGLAAVATHQHASVLIAGFAAGAVLALLGEPRRLAEQLIGLGEGFLVPVFFVTLGAKLQLAALFTDRRNLVLAAVIALGATAVHVVAAVVCRLPVGAGLLATAQLGVPAAIASIGLTSGALVAGQAAAVLAGVLASLAACAVGAGLLGHTEPIGDHTAPPDPRLGRGAPGTAQ